MFNFKEFHMNLTLQSVGKVIVERICQYSVNELLDQFQQSVLLNLIDLSDLSFQFWDSIRNQIVSGLEFFHIFF
jgi:hypothetical protein